MGRNVVNTTPIDTDGTKPFSSTIKFDKFSQVIETQVAKIATSKASKSCSLDSLPTVVLKHCPGALLPIITKIANLSLSEGIVPYNVKMAALEPRLKKPPLTTKN